MIQLNEFFTGVQAITVLTIIAFVLVYAVLDRKAHRK
jgi:hypothetical protein